MSNEEKKPIVDIESAIDIISVNLKKNEDLYEETHDLFQNKISSGKKKEKLLEMTLSGALSDSGTKHNSRDATELAKVLTSIRSSALSGSKILFDAIKEKELLDIKKEEIELKKKALEQESESKAATSEILREALLQARTTNSNAIVDIAADINKDIGEASKLALDKILESTDLNESETNMVKSKTNKKNDLNINVNVDEKEVKNIFDRIDENKKEI